MTIRTRDILLYSGTETTDGEGSSSNITDMARFIMYLIVSGLGGTSPTLTVTIQDSPDGDNWVNVGSFAVASAVGTIALRPSASLGRYIRAAWTLGGTTPTFTFDVVCIARGE